MAYPNIIIRSIAAYRNFKHRPQKKWMLGRLGGRKTIIVTGCQRSGTTSIAKMIAHDMQYVHKDEYEFNTHDYGQFVALSREHAPLVVHCPALSHRILDMVNDLPMAHIVWVSRPFHEIRKSMERIGWDKKEEDVEKGKYAELILFSHEPIEHIKTRYWKEKQATRLDNSQYTELAYHSPYVQCHPLFISSKYRGDFSSKKTTL